MEVYPNATTNRIDLDIEREVDYQIVSTSGQRVLEGQLLGRDKQIDISQFPAGT
jgi:hypothetical protein